MTYDNNLWKSYFAIHWDWRYPSTWWITIKRFFKTVKYSWQRVIKGYSTYDLYDFDYFIGNLLKDALQEFANKTNSYPGRYNDVNEWKLAIMNMRNLAKHFLDYEDPNNSYEAEECQEAINNFFDALKENFRDLWI